MATRSTKWLSSFAMDLHLHEVALRAGQNSYHWQQRQYKTAMFCRVYIASPDVPGNSSASCTISQMGRFDWGWPRSGSYCMPCSSSAEAKPHDGGADMLYRIAGLHCKMQPAKTAALREYYRGPPALLTAILINAARARLLL